MATQNPIETEGTYPLPEAQVDRFMMKVLVGYPSEDEEFVIVERVTGAALDGGDRRDHRRSWLALQRECRNGYVDPSLINTRCVSSPPRAIPTATASSRLRAVSSRMARVRARRSI